MIIARRKKLKIRRLKSKKEIEAAEISTSSSPWIELPRDMMLNILNRLGAIEILESAQKVCTTWWKVCQDPSLWHVIDMNGPDICENISYDRNMCRHAVDLSQGELIDINIEYFGDDALLNYISERSSHLRRLRLACCVCIRSQALREAVRNFPELEELHLFFMPFIRARDIETIGISCPMLKSFTFNIRAYKALLKKVDNEYALAVAKAMPNLCHLRLLGNGMTNKGLQAILDGCPHLESLDLRQCFRVNLKGYLGKRCSLHIKDLRLPSESTSDYEWDDQIYTDNKTLL